MHWFKNMKIRTKMLISFMLVIALIMALVVVAATQIRRVSDDYMVVINHPLALEITALRFQGEYREIRRIVATIVTRTEEPGVEPAELESFFDSARAGYGSAVALLDRARTIIETAPKLTKAEKDVRLANNEILHGLLKRYHDEVIVPSIDAARARDHAMSMKLFEPATAITSVMRGKIEEIRQMATETVAMRFRETEERARTNITLLIAISLVAALIAVAIAFYAANRVSKPLAPLTGFMRNVASSGDIAFSAGDAAIIRKVARERDELGMALNAAKAFIERVGEIGDILGKVADGDLAVRAPLLSEKDVIGMSLAKTLDGLNAMFAEINDASVQVATASGQVADGAHAIASGAAEQVASIEELSCSLSDVEQRTKENAEMAGQAALLAKTIMDNAEKGRLRMEAMLAAAAQISEASQAIGKVIKTIDDIAFQTNILAINASVEAAHAGRQGRGFAVVAAEVRNLAAKSAKAAKDTESLIADSMEKTELGVQIAGETSASLLEILSGINENTRLVSGIADASEQQSHAIAHIATNIDQVAQVVQQNSATAEESAAASREMSRQAGTLRRLIAQFRLRKY
ncbi:MAG: methyl-accepting chemotaxis protein [Planctomycetota bacterium]|jgi:methyl-accepting chemotaxis protein|nr:methyl-accepting chemotaxis protein [Planctomycetota bacterium]